MADGRVAAIAAGHICLDIIPQLNESQSRPEDLFSPGRLVQVGPATIALGGSAANTGLALHRLGIATSMMGKVGDDLLGGTILQALRAQQTALAEGMIVAAGEASSYTVVMNPPGVDRCFLHCPGTNDTFVADDFAMERLAGARLLNFGYPTLMQGIFSDGGAGLADRFRQIGQQGLLVSLDMGMPDPAAAAGQVDWAAWLTSVLPSVDVFLPSLDEVLLMLDRPRFDRLVQDARGGDPAAAADAELLDGLAKRLLGMGAKIVVLKLGDQGLYLRTSDTVLQLNRRSAWADFAWDAWRNRQLLAPCFSVPVVGTTGSGDCTIAGFLAGMLHGLSPEETLRGAVGVGACNVQSPDATSGIPSWDEVQQRMANWGQRDVDLSLEGWNRSEASGLLSGPLDCAG